MRRREFMWSLANGVRALALSGAFWFGMAAWPAARPIFFCLVWVIVFGFAAILWAATRLRRKSHGFKPSELKHADESERREDHKMFVRFHLVNGGHIILILLSSALCYHFGHRDLVWPCMALIVGLHYFPFGWLFKVRAYHVTGIAGTTVALVAILGPGGPVRLVYLGLGMGLALWLTAIYIVWQADAIADHGAVGEKA